MLKAALQYLLEVVATANLSFHMKITQRDSGDDDSSDMGKFHGVSIKYTYMQGREYVTLHLSSATVNHCINKHFFE